MSIQRNNLTAQGQKWKTFSIGDLNMKQIRNESGITLAELLAALAIGSIIIVMVTGIFVTFYKQYDKQSTQIRALANVTNATQAITKDIRQAFDVEVAESKDRINIIFEDETISYVFADG